MPMTIARIAELIRDGKEHDFYISKAWKKKRKAVLEKDKNECQMCKGKGIYSRATTVHHVRHLLDNPVLALEEHYTDEHGNKQRQLISLCDTCHKAIHREADERDKKQECIADERW